MATVLDQKYDLVPISALQPHPDNPRKGDLDTIAESVDANGFYGALVVQRSTGYVLAGNHRLLAAQRQGLSTLPVVWLDVDDDRARRILLVDNRSNDLAAYDEGQLASLLEELSVTDLGLLGTGYTAADLKALGGAEPPAALNDPDEIPEGPAETISKTGDLWLLGPHRLLCGDSTSVDDVQRVMNGVRATLMATDPPYLVDYDGSNHPQAVTNAAMTKNKAWDDYKDPRTGVDFYVAFLAAALEHALAERAAIYQWHADLRRPIVVDAWETCGILPHQVIIWAKARPVLTRSDFMWMHEPAMYGWKKGMRPDTDRRPPANETTLWPIAQRKVNDIHPTEKPVEIFNRAISYHTRVGEVCFEPFSGSGSHIIAAHGLNRACYAIEQAPQYVDVACRRYQEHTGILPVRESTGEQVDFSVGGGDG